MNVSIRNIALASGLTLVSLLGLSTTVQAQTTGTTSLQVTITNNCTFVNTPTGLAESVTSYSAIATKFLTSALTVSCNGNNFFVNAKSANGGVLKDPAIATTIPYTVATSNDTMGTGSFFSAAPLTTTDTLIVTKTGYSSSCAAAAGCSANLTWALSAPGGGAGLPIGIYKDTITYTLSAN